MKDELIKLGFELKNNNQWYLKIRNLKNITINVNVFNIVWIEQNKEAIRKAWGVYFEHFGEHETKHSLENDGFCYVPSITLGLILRKYGEDWLEVNKDLKYRPKSLQGIETNNGWIKIESEEDLPNTGIYWVIRKGSETPIRAEIDINDNFHKAVWIAVYTHYQPIEKPKPPIY